MKSIERLKKAIEFLKSSDKELTSELISFTLGYRSKGYVSDITSGAKPINDIFLSKLKTEYSVNPDWILHGKGQMILPGNIEPVEEYQTTRRNKKLTGTGKRIPLYDAPALGGLTETDMTPIHAPAGTIDVGDLLHDSQAAIRIYGNSMLPGYPPGCVVGLNKVTANFIEPGEIYVIETIDRRILKRLFYANDDPLSDSLYCISDNTMLFEGGARHGKLAYPPFTIPKKEIKQLFVVTGVIKRNSNSVIINRKA